LITTITALLVLAGLPAAASAAPRGLPGTVACERASGDRQTVLLVHGTGATPQEAWSWAYRRALRADGFGVCTVRLPQRALVDFTESAEVAADAARAVHRYSGRKIAMIGHSQAGLMVAWLVKFFPDVARITGDAISLAGPMNGTALADALCATGGCAPIAWQLRTDSALVKAFTRAPVPAGPSITSLSTRYDTVVFPQPAAGRLDGARSILVQDVCPAQLVEHGTMITDPAVYAMVIDALKHAGPASPSRVRKTVCGNGFLPHLDPSGAPGATRTITELGVGLMNPANWVDAEPRLPAYARR
jgi:pimeloyl-ACP methyl ester carboxylesterase